MLKLDTLESLKERLCPFCESIVEFDEKYLHCPHCKIGWSYNEYKLSLDIYDKDPENYSNQLTYDNPLKYDK